MKMKGIILAGGTGSRLSPLTEVTNKHLLPVGREPMIHYPLKNLIRAGIKDILVVTGIEHAGDVFQLLGSGSRYECNLTYRIQDQAGGIAQALLLGKDFVGSDNVTVILGDNIFDHDLALNVWNFDYWECESKCGIFIKEVQDPERFGVVTIKKDYITQYDVVESIEEKPKDPKSNLAVTGVYMYDSTCFEVIEKLRPSDRGELEVTDLNNHFVAQGSCRFTNLDGFWSDAGTFESLKIANEWANSEFKGFE